MELPALPRSRAHAHLIVSLELIVLALAIAIASTTTHAQAPLASPSASPSPAPAPAPAFVNITQVLVYAGDYTTFVNLLIETQVAQKFQNQANQTQVGISIFAPTNAAFNTPPASILLKNLTEQQKMSLLEYHALNNWQSLDALQHSSQNVTTTFATYNGGGRYQFNITDEQGTVEIFTGYDKANITSTLYNEKPCSIFGINAVLLPEDLFGLPAPAPAPSPFSGAPSPSGSPSSAAQASGPSSDTSFAPPPFTPSLSSLIILASLLSLKQLLLQL